MNVQASTYLTQLVSMINQRLKNVSPTLLYGENINYGSRLSGLARGIDPLDRHTILNVGNSELTHIGMGMGIMLDGGNAVLFVKQSDFLLLGLDQMINTYNYVRAYCERDRLGSFTIYSIVCDHGYQGPQSSLNSPHDFASLANINTYCINGAADANWVINNQFVNTGFRLVFVSQRLFETKSSLPNALNQQLDGSIFHYRAGNAATVVCTGFGLCHGMQVALALEDIDASVDLFHVNFVQEMDLEEILRSCAITGKLMIIDDSKSVSKLGDLIVNAAKEQNIDFKLMFQGRRGVSNDHYGVNPDEFSPDIKKLIKFVHET